MSYFKYNDKLPKLYSSAEIIKLEEGARELKEDFNCELLVASTNISGAYKSVTITISQGYREDGVYLDKAELEEKVEILFKPFLQERILYVRPLPHKVAIVEVVSPEWLKERMLKKGVRIKDIMIDTGLDKTNLSAWLSGARVMSQPVKAMFYFYLTRVADKGQVLGAFFQDLDNATPGAVLEVPTEHITEMDVRSEVMKKANELNCQVLIGDFSMPIADITFYEPRRYTT